MDIKKLILRIILVLFLLPSILFAWNSNGHRVIAQIAYDQLTPTAKKQIDAIIAKKFHAHYADDRFLLAATWPDQIKHSTSQYNAWHYINLPDVYDDITPPPLNPQNAVWAIDQSEQILKDDHTPSKKAAQYLSFLIHFVGDIHQPLHSICRYSHIFPPPAGDEGGNYYFIQAHYASNLHSLWDMGLGVFHSAKPFSYYKVVWMAKQLEEQYPPSFFQQRLLIDSSEQWAKESFDLAKTAAYTTPKNDVPTTQYMTNGAQIASEQAALAGYRLANVLNQIFEN